MLIDQQIHNKTAIKPRFYLSLPDRFACVGRGTCTLALRCRNHEGRLGSVVDWRRHHNTSDSVNQHTSTPIKIGKLNYSTQAPNRSGAYNSQPARTTNKNK